VTSGKIGLTVFKRATNGETKDPILAEAETALKAVARCEVGKRSECKIFSNEA